MKRKTCTLIPVFVLIFSAALRAQAPSDKTAGSFGGDPDANPPVTQADLRIVRRASEILDSPAKWDRADTRACPAGAKIFSLYCALEKATYEVSGNFEHRGAAMQQARLVIDDIAPNHSKYEHRLMGYNNDPTTTFADIQKFFRLLKDRVAKELAEQSPGGER